MSIRSDIYDIVNAVAGTGNVFSYKRYKRSLYDEQLSIFKTEIDGEDTIRGFDVQAGPVVGELMDFSGGTINTHTFLIHGYVTWNDADASETAAENLARAVMQALNDSDTLHDGGTYYHSERAQITALEGRRFMGVLLNYIGITQKVLEYTA